MDEPPNGFAKRLAGTDVEEEEDAVDAKAPKAAAPDDCPGVGVDGAIFIWREAIICCLKLSSCDCRNPCRDEASAAEIPVEGALAPSPRSGAEEEEAAPAPDVSTPPVELVTTGIELEEEETVT